MALILPLLCPATPPPGSPGRSQGSKQEIGESLIQVSGDVREAIVFVEEPATIALPDGSEDIFAEIRPFMVDVPEVDDSRQLLLRRRLRGFAGFLRSFSVG